MSALEQSHGIFADPPIRADSLESVAERRRILEFLLDPGCFASDGASRLVHSHQDVFASLGLRHFHLSSHYDPVYQLPPVIEFVCQNPTAYRLLCDSLDRDGQQDRLCEALAMHGYRALRLVDGPHRRMQILPGCPAAVPARMRVSSLRDILEPLFHGQVVVVPGFQVQELLDVMVGSTRLTARLERVFWEENFATQCLTLMPLADIETSLALVSQQIFRALFRQTTCLDKALLRDLALSVARGRETVVPATIREDFLRLLDASPALYQRFLMLHWRRHDEHGVLRLEPIHEASETELTDVVVRVAETRLNVLIQRILRHECVVVPADLRTTLLNLLETTSILRSAVAKADWRLHQQSGLMMLDFRPS